MVDGGGSLIINYELLIMQIGLREKGEKLWVGIWGTTTIFVDRMI